MTVQKTKLAYTRTEAAEATGLSPDTIDDAIRAGDLRATRPVINGRRIRTSSSKETSSTGSPGGRSGDP